MHSKFTCPEIHYGDHRIPENAVVNKLVSQPINNLSHKSNESKCDSWGNEMCCKNSNKAGTWSMFPFFLYGVFFPQTIQAVQVDGAQLWWGLSSPMDKDCSFWSGFMQVVRVEQHGGVVSFHYLLIIDINPTGLNCIYSTLWFTEDVYPGHIGWLSYHHEWSWCHWIYHGWFWFSKSFWGKSVRQTLFNTSCLANHNIHSGPASSSCSHQSLHCHSLLHLDSPS